MEAETISRALARFVHGLSYSDLPENVSAMAKSRLLDSLSAEYATLTLPLSRIALSVVKDSKGKATIIGQRRGYAIKDAAFVNGILAHGVFQEDSQKEGGHPSTTIVPTALAVAENEGASGPDLILAIVIGYEIMRRITLGTPAEAGREGLRAGFRNSTVFGIFGATAAAARLMKLSEDRVANALGYATSLAGGLTEGWTAGSMEAMVQAGLAAQNGIMAAMLARSGATASETCFEGKHGFYESYAQSMEKVSSVVADLGKSFAILETRSKLYPVSGTNQHTISLGKTLISKHRFDPAELATVVMRVSPKTKGYPGSDVCPPYRTRYQAVMSTQFCLASALLGKPVESFKYFENHFDDQEVARLAQRIQLIAEDQMEVPRLEVCLRDGRKYAVENDASLVLTPTWESTEAKFRRLASESLDEEEITTIVAAVKNLGSFETLLDLTQELRLFRRLGMRTHAPR